MGEETWRRIREIPPLPERPDDAHKGQVGRITVVGGRMDEVGMVGAPAMVANAAFYCGAGLVQVLTPRSAMPSVAVLAPCATTRALPLASDEVDLVSINRQLDRAIQNFRTDVLAVGPGLAAGFSAQQMEHLLASAKVPMVIDADGLNLLATMKEWFKLVDVPVVITPHPGEIERLREGMGLATESADRNWSAVEVAQKTGAVVVLKGAGTVVTDAKRLFVNETGNSGMATGGSGDVLTGTIAALMGQKLSAFDAAVLGVYLHGLAGDLCADECGAISMTAWDLCESLPDALLGENRMGPIT